MSERRCRVVSGPIDAAALVAAPGRPGDGAALLFVGRVRDHNDGRDVGHLEYRAYVPMAEKVLEEIVREAEARWEVGEMAVVHRVGRLEIGEAAVAILVGAAHRGDAYEASRYVIEELKKRVPIWKREGYVEGDSEWLPGSAPAVAEGADG